MKRKVFAIITAGGTGTRFSGDTSQGKPKQFLNLKGKPVIVHSMTAFQKASDIDEIIISADLKYFSLLHSLAIKYSIKKLSGLVEGGKTRFNSVRNAVNSIEGRKNDLVMIHDAARPNVNKNLITKMISYGREAVAGVVVSDTVKRTDKNKKVINTVDRKDLWIIQTPQVFRYGVIMEAYRRSGKKAGFTDEAALVEDAGYTVKVIEGSKENIKLTTKEDFDYLKIVM